MDQDGGESAFAFEGNWREYAPIAFTNLLLTIVTLGVYRFWGTARTRRYLWSRSRFVDETLEWSGTGKELFVGFVLVLVLLGLPFFVLSFLAQRLIMEGNTGLGVGLAVVPYVLVFYLGGVARFRALRYRLSRTRWHGIRGGSEDNGFGYGWSYAWRTIVGWLPAGLLAPWAMAHLWNERWNAMSFGPFRFESEARSGGIYGRFLLFYLSPLIVFLGMGFLGITGGLAGYAIGGDDGAANGILISVIGAILFFYLGLGLIAVAFYAKYYREMVGAMRWRNLSFAFEATTGEWVKLLLGDVLLVVGTLFVGSIFLQYRHWKFFITHLEARGEILLDELTQSTTPIGSHGEGMLDAFDIGAI